MYFYYINECGKLGGVFKEVFDEETDYNNPASDCLMMLLSRWRRPVVLVTGSCVALTGILLMPVPGPGGTPVFLAGLALLGSEAEWARRLLVRFKEAYGRMSKRKRFALTCSVLAFYLATGLVAWSLMNRPVLGVAERL